MDIMLWEADKQIMDLQKQLKEKEVIIKSLHEVLEYNEQEIQDLHNELNKSQDAEYVYQLETKIVKLKKLTNALLKSQRNFVFSYRF